MTGPKKKDYSTVEGTSLDVEEPKMSRVPSRRVVLMAGAVFAVAVVSWIACNDPIVKGPKSAKTPEVTMVAKRRATPSVFGHASVKAQGWVPPMYHHRDAADAAAGHGSEPEISSGAQAPSVAAGNPDMPTREDAHATYSYQHSNFFTKGACMEMARSHGQCLYHEYYCFRCPQPHGFGAEYCYACRGMENWEKLGFGQHSSPKMKNALAGEFPTPRIENYLDLRAGPDGHAANVDGIAGVR